MLTGKELGAAIGEAIRIKGVTKASVARHFKIKPPSISDWIKRGTIDKAKLDELFSYFSDVVGPEHWGISASRIAPRHKIQEERAAYHARPLVKTVYDLTERISDEGLAEAITYLEFLAVKHPVNKAKLA